MLTARHIEALHAVMRAGTVRGAATLLGVAQPGLSRMIRHIEDRLGYALFDRSSGRLVPTQEAHLLARRIDEVYKGLTDLDMVARQLAAGDGRSFRIAASPSIGHSLIPRILVRLTDVHPGLQLQFDIVSVEQTDDYLLLGRGDYTVTLFAMTSPTIHSIKLGDTPLKVALHRDHPLAARERIDPAMVAALPFITFREDTPHGRAIAKVLGGHPADVRVYIRFGETALAFVAQDMGVAIIDGFTAEQMRDPAIVIRPLDRGGTLPVHLNRSLTAPRSAIGATFEALAREMVRAEE